MADINDSNNDTLRPDLDFEGEITYEYSEEQDPFGVLAAGQSSHIFRCGDFGSEYGLFKDNVIAIRSNDTIFHQTLVTTSPGIKFIDGAPVVARVYDSSGIIILDWISGKVKVGCNSYKLHQNTKQVPGIYKSTDNASFHSLSHYYHRC